MRNIGVKRVFDKKDPKLLVKYFSLFTCILLGFAFITMKSIYHKLPTEVRSSTISLMKSTGLNNCQIDPRASLPIRLAIVVTSSLSETDFKFINSQRFDKGSIVEWIVFKTSLTSIPRSLVTIKKQVIEVDDINNEIALLLTAKKKSNSEYIFFLPFKVSLFTPQMSTDIFNYKLKALNCHKETAILGGLSIYPIDLFNGQPIGNIFRKEKELSYNIYSMSYGVSTTNNNIPTTYHQKFGKYLFSLPKNFMENQFTFCSVLAGSFVKTSLLNDIKLENQGFRELNELHLCLELFKKKRKIQFNHDAIVNDFSIIVPYQKVQRKENQKKKTRSGLLREKFFKKNMYTLLEYAEQVQKSIPHTNLNIVWEMGSGDCNSWFLGSLGYISNSDMYSAAPNIRTVYDGKICSEVESFKLQSLERSMAKSYIGPQIDVYISHNSLIEYPARFPNRKFENLDGVPKLRIGKIVPHIYLSNEEWIHNFKFVDELWVPNSKMITQLLSIGIDSNKVFLVPDSVDSEFFSPNYSQYLSVEQLQKVIPQLEFRERGFHVFTKVNSIESFEPLLFAFFSEFKTSNEITLHIYYHPHDNKSKRKEKVLRETVESLRSTVAKLRNIKKEDLPYINLITDPIPIRLLPHLYINMDVFVLIDKGDEYLPYMEAMAMGVPCIGTNLEGHAGLIDKTHAYMIDTDEKMNPNKEHIQQLLRHVFTNRKEAKLIGFKGREFVVRNYSSEVIQARMLERLSKLEKSLSSKRTYLRLKD